MSQSTRSKGVRSSTPIAKSVAAESTSSDSRPASPTSGPLLFSRIEEKRNLQQLNDRLAAYIDKVRSLESENVTLFKRVQSSEESYTKEVASVKVLYEDQLSSTRKQLDTALKAQSALQVDQQKASAAAEEAKARAAQLEKETSKLRSKLENVENELRRLKGEHGDILDRMKKAEHERDAIAKELAEERKASTSLKNQLHNETVSRIDLETQLKSLEEQLAFEKHVHREELNSSRTRQVEIEEQVARDVEAKYAQRLGDELSELRAESDEKLRAARAELESQYETQLRNLQAKLDQRSSSEGKMRTEYQALRSKCDSFDSQRKQLEGTIRSLEERVSDLEKLLDQERTWHQQALEAKEKELDDLHEQIKNHMKEYQDLYDVKVILDLEIETYRKLMEAEETRLNSSVSDISSVSFSSASALSASPRLGKRKRQISEEEHYATEYNTESQLNGDVEVIEHDQEGQFVRVENKGDKDISLAGWQIIRKAGEETITYKFHRNLVLKVNSTITIWSHNVKGVSHNPPTDLVMKSQVWPAAAEIATILLDNSGKEVAIRTTKLKTNKRRLTHSQFGPDGDKSCLVM